MAVMKRHDPPEWAGNPVKDYWLEEIKGGMIHAQHELTEKSFFVVGSDRQNADIVYENPSVSRRHAIIQFDDRGDPYCYDISRHGSYRNKERLPRETYVKLQSGDQLLFGVPQSVRRVFFLCCGDEENEDTSEDEKTEEVRKETATVANPGRTQGEEEESVVKESDDTEVPQTETATAKVVSPEHGGMKRNRDVLLRCGLREKTSDDSLPRDAEVLEVNTSGGEDEGAACWGIDTDAGEENKLDKFIDFETGMINIDKLREEHHLTARQEKSAIELETRYRRLTSLRREVGQLDHQLERLTNSESSDTSRLQSRRKALEDQLEAAEGEVDAAQETFAASLGWHDSGYMLPSVTNKVKDSIDSRLFDEDDEFFDRTNDRGKRGKKNWSEKIETEDSLRQRASELRLELEAISLKFAGGPDEAKTVEEADVDPLDAYMEQLEKNEKAKAEDKKLELTKELGEVEKLLKVVVADGRAR